MFFQEEDCEDGHSGTLCHEAVSDRIQALQEPLAGDFYRDQDTVRGLTLDNSSWTTPPNMQSACEAYGEEEMAWNVPEHIQPKEQLGQQSRSLFQPHDFPPLLPDHSCFKIEATTLFLGTEEAWIAGNRLVDFLNLEAAAHIKKVNRRKFTVKAAALWQGLTCEMKLRAYRMPCGQSAFEFQRVGGDCLAFNGLFRLLKQHICGIEEQTSPDCQLPPPSPCAQFSGEADKNSSLLPLIDTARNADDVGAQAEAAAGLARAAEDANCMPQLCTPGACDAIRKLMEVDRFEVSCQVARLLSKLALSPVAEVCFLGEGLLRLILEKVVGFATGQLLRLQLGEALERLAARCVGLLPKKATDDLGRALRVSFCPDAPSQQAPAVLSRAARWLPPPPTGLEEKVYRIDSFPKDLA